MSRASDGGGAQDEDVDEHPEPTGATVKQLYAHAFLCAHPDCSRPLYRLDDETGDLTLNSRVAHIHARRRGGPRWVTMTSAANRSASNLVLLCIEHSYEVDEHPASFPAETLRAWKADQLAEHQRVLQSWPLTDEKVETVRLRSFRDGAQAHVDAEVLAELARQVEFVRTRARRGREGPRERANYAAKRWAQARLGFTAWNAETGEPVYAEPSPMEQDALRLALGEAVDDG